MVTVSAAKRIHKAFSSCSELSLSSQKTTLLNGSITQQGSKELQEACRIQLAAPPIRYVGPTLVVGRLSPRDYQPLIERELDSVKDGE